MIGILGGSFDPVHYGHLRPAAEVLQAVALEAVRFVPSARPPHRAMPHAAARHRLRMVELAIAEYDGFAVDEREIRMGGVSYTVRTLRSLRAELGEVALALIVGADAFLGLPSWHHWEEIPRLAHLIVMERPGWDLRSALPVWAEDRLCADTSALEQEPSGRVYLVSVTPVDISSTQIRDTVARGGSIDGLVPPAVRDYVEQFGLYRGAPARQGVV